ncbi:nucleotidyltransferase family protein [Algoriphagus sp. CAU 1675]|uniref:nucleotidyltransferase family protein n=1 Tax=Algoriphagus sp. CAU 1675 TaxID=3032597 RepID=UPI0023D98F55|nr:nucleotidyltransferase family protein [Algoriphagus sp. CAU 1675]MDF2157960.1 nucleotidyltransferase family protein [Algoriphagus sp. CAU 1675]
MKKTKLKTGIIILAAGSSSRLGQPKQLIQFKGKCLLQNAIEAAQRSKSDHLVVVLGFNPELIKTGFDSGTVPYVVNNNWSNGMASSIQTGLNFLLSKGELDQVVLMLCDQPHVTSSLIDQLIEKKEESKKGIIASYYSGTLGVPALFEKKYFPKLFELEGAEGARKIIAQNPEDLAPIQFSLGEIDVDTAEDLEKLK